MARREAVEVVELVEVDDVSPYVENSTIPACATKLAVRQRLFRTSASATPTTIGTRIGASPISDPTYDASVQNVVRWLSSHSGNRSSARRIASFARTTFVSKRPRPIMIEASRSINGWATIQDTASEGRRRRYGANDSDGPPTRGLTRLDARESSGTPETFGGGWWVRSVMRLPSLAFRADKACRRATPAECRSRKRLPAV